MTTAAAVLILAGVLLFAVIRPWGLPEVVAAVPGAVLVAVLGLVPVRAALSELVALGPTVGFLAAVLVLAHLADEEGVFRYAGRWPPGLVAARRNGCSSCCLPSRRW